MNILMLDVETAPNIATVWGIWQQNIGINQLQETSRVMCYSARWYGEAHAYFGSEFEMGHEDMISSLHTLLDNADVVCHYNGKKFDMPVINREFLKYGMLPPAPYKQIDLMQVVKKNFRFVSNKMDHICDELGLGRKLHTGGHELWLKCMDGDKTAWKTMEEYNIQDVVMLGELYEKLKPWISDHPNMALYVDTDNPVCPNCGGNHLHSRGLSHTNVQSYRRFHCQDCGTWVRGRNTVLTKYKRGHVLTQVKS